MPTRRTPRAQRVRRDRGDGTLDHLKSGRWSVRVTGPDGSRTRLRGGPWDTEQEARDALIRWQAQRLDGHAARSSLATTSLKTVYLRSIEPLGGLDGSADRRTFYRGAIERPVGPETGRTRVRVPEGRVYLGHLPVGEITIETVEEWAAALRATGLGPSTIAKWGRHLSQCMAWAAARGYVPSNPVPGAVLLPRGAAAASRPPRYFLTLEEITRIIAVTPVEYRLMIETLMWSGLRQGEVRALTPESLIHKPGAMLAVTASVHDGPGAPTLGRTKTLGSQRRVPVPRGLMDDLGTLVAESVSRGRPLFPSSTGGWMRGDTVADVFARSVADAGITGDPLSPHLGRRKTPTPHDCRATGASLLFAAGAGVPEVQAFLGHTQPAITLRLYTEVQGWGEEDPVLAGLRAQRLTVPEILDTVYQEVTPRVHRLIRERASDDAARGSSGTASPA